MYFFHLISVLRLTRAGFVYVARKPGPGRCVHCLKFVDKRNWDHVFPVSWYPDSTPKNLEKWKIPTCKPCNDEYGKIEEDFGRVLSMCVDPRRPESSGIYKRMIRAFDPRNAKNDKDRRIREAKRQQVLSEMMHGDEIPGEGTYPGLGERWGRPREEQTALLLPKRYVDSVGFKVVRGIAYIEDGNYIDEKYTIEPFVVAEEGAHEFEQAIRRYGHSLSRGPGIIVDRAVVEEDGISSIYKVTIWGQFLVYLSVFPNEYGA